MIVNRVLEVQNEDALGAVRSFLTALWEQVHLEAMLAPVEQPDGSGCEAQLLLDKSWLGAVDPFVPIMKRNTAGMVGSVLKHRPDQRLGVVLRPCELRALVELRKRGWLGPIDVERVVLIGVDCLGTFPREVYQRAAAARGAKQLTAEILMNAGSGGLHPQDFRTACQVCDCPAPCGADVVIGTLGVDADQSLLLQVRDEAIDSRLGLAGIAPGMASEYQVSHRETVSGAIADLRAGTRRKMIESLPEAYRFSDLGSFLAWLANCSLCGQCLKACPLYVELSAKGSSERGAVRPGEALLIDLVALSRWLASCSGCGMCEESCRQQVPLTLLISALSHRIRGEMGYRCGDPAASLPWQ